MGGDEGEDQLVSLTSLDISDNYLSLSGVNLTALPSLLAINLGQTNMTELASADLSLLPTAITSIIINNISSLHTIHPGALAMFDKLENVVITNNPSLHEIHQGLLTSSKRHVSVNLSSNGITWLDPACLPWPRVSLLDLTGNPLHCDCHLSWLTHMSSTRVLSATCHTPAQLSGTNVTGLDTGHMSCALMGPAQISLLSVCLVIISLILGCISFACYTCRRSIPRRLGISDLPTKTPWQTFSNDYCPHDLQHQTPVASVSCDNIVAGAAPSRWTFIQPECDCRDQVWFRNANTRDCSNGGIYTIRWSKKSKKSYFSQLHSILPSNISTSPTVTIQILYSAVTRVPGLYRVLGLFLLAIPQRKWVLTAYLKQQLRQASGKSYRQIVLKMIQ